MIDIQLGDCMELFKNIDDNSIDCIVTSPPYNKKGLSGRKPIKGKIWSNLNIDYDNYEDDMDEDTYIQWQINFLNQCNRVIKPTGSVFYNHKVRRYNNQAFFPYWVFNSDLKFYQQIIWDRTNFADMNVDYLYPNTELIFWLTKDKPKVFKKCVYNQTEIWKIPPSTGDVHPATFPYDIPLNCILLTTEENDTVLDPFSGVGTTALVCKDYNRNYIGFEISEKYFNIQNERVKNHIKGEKDIKHDGAYYSEYKKVSLF